MSRPLVADYPVEESTVIVHELGPAVQLELPYRGSIFASTPEGIRQMRRLLNEVEDALVRLEQREGWA